MKTTSPEATLNAAESGQFRIGGDLPVHRLGFGAMLPIPGTSSVAHLEENVGAASVQLTDSEWNEISRLHP